MASTKEERLRLSRAFSYPKWAPWGLLALIAVAGATSKIVDLIGLRERLSSTGASLTPRFHFFSVADVAIKVSAPLVESEVRTWLPDLSGKSLLFLSSSMIVEKLKTHPWVGEVAVRKVFPDRLELSIEPKTPVMIRIRKGSAYYVDGRGQDIGKVEPRIKFQESFSVVSFADPRQAGWESVDSVTLLAEIKAMLPAGSKLSELSFSSYPVFRAFLISPALEVILNFENWKSQMPFLTRFLASSFSDPSARLPRTPRINLMQSKKAVVSSPISK